jgi:hypothetical protein
MMTNEAEKAEFEADFAAQARHAREELTAALATLTEQAHTMLETALAVEHDAQTREGVDRKASEAAVRLVGTARRETKLALERVARTCGVA